MKLRFSASNVSGATGYVVTPYTLGLAGGAMAATATTAYPLSLAVKVSRIRLWASSSNTTTNLGATASVQWSGSGGNFATNFDVSDTTVSSAYPAFVDSSPPVRSLAADYSVCTNTGTLCSIAVSNNVDLLVEVDAVYVLNDGTAGTVQTVAGATVGMVYYAPLDGRSGILLPVSKTVMT